VTETSQHYLVCASSGFITLYFGGGGSGVSDFVTLLA
jgi:hypothetical protein